MNPRLVVIATASVAVVVAIVVAIVVVTTRLGPGPPASQPPTQRVMLTFQDACKGTKCPETCLAFLAPQGKQNFEVIELLQRATRVCSIDVKKNEDMLTFMLHKGEGNQNLTRAVRSCRELLRNAENRIKSTVEALPRGDIKGARAWMSAAMVYETACNSNMKKIVDELPWVSESMTYLTTLLNMTGDALSMIVSYDIHGNETKKWSPPQTERDGFWEPVSGPTGASALTFTGEFPSGLTANVTVCDGSKEKCNFTKVQEAVDAAPNNETEKFVIHIKGGVYNETVRVWLEKKNVVFIGDGMGKTVISGSLNVGQPGMNTYESATVGVLGDGFMAKDLTIENTAGPQAHQAIAFRSDSDLSIIESCEFIGNQDTLCPNTLRQYYKSCRIQGNVDFIFGFASAVFQDSLILVSSRQTVPENNVITANGRFHPAQSSGFVFLNCTINGTTEYLALCNKDPKNCVTSLGRPWKEYSRTVFVKCDLGTIISPKGWIGWEGGDLGLSTLYYGEFESTGPGAKPSEREKWSSQILADQVNRYSVQNFIQGDKWIPQPAPKGWIIL